MSILISVLCLFAIGPAPIFALSLEDYFTYTLTTEFSKTDISGSETFTATIEGTATSIAEMPLTPLEAQITSRVVAEHQVSGAEVTLNEGYSVTLASFPGAVGETSSASEVVSLVFPSGSASGTYDLVGEVIEADVRFAIIDWFDVTSWLPSSEPMGSVTYTADGGGGGGGGGGGIVIESDNGILDYIDEDGVFTDDITAESEDSQCLITIVEGTIGLDEDGDPLSELNVVEVEELPSAPADFPAEVIGSAYDIGPDGATFDPPIALTMEYNENLMPDGVAEENLTIATWDDAADEWVNLDDTVDTVDNTITAEISHLTDFAILAYTRPAAFTGSNLAITPTEVDIGEEVTINLLITNSGDLTGSYEAVLKIDDAEVETEEVTLSGGDNVAVSFSISLDAAGVYTVAVGGLSGTLEVRTPEVEVDEIETLSLATFTAADLSISPAEVVPGESVKISVTVTNTSSLSGTYEVTLKIDDVILGTKEVTLAGGEGQMTTFTIAKGTAGTYRVNVAGLSGSFIVKEGPPPLSPAAEQINWPALGGIIGGVIVVGLLIFLLVRRH